MNDLALFAAGVDEHEMDQAIESYGGVKKEKQPAKGTTVTFEDTEDFTTEIEHNVSVRGKSIRKVNEINYDKFISYY